MEEITPSSECRDCWKCSKSIRITGERGEKYILGLLKNSCANKAYDARYNGSGHGIDIIVFDDVNKIVILHESKYSGASKPVTPGRFKSLLGKTQAGQQCSLSWLDDVFNEMLGSRTDNLLNKSYKFLRTGNLRSDNESPPKIQLYKITNANHRGDVGTEAETEFTEGTFIEKYNYGGPRTREKANESTMSQSDIVTYFQ